MINYQASGGRRSLDAGPENNPGVNAPRLADRFLNAVRKTLRRQVSALLAVGFSEQPGNLVVPDCKEQIFLWWVPVAFQ